MDRDLAPSRHFTLQRLSDGVYAAIAKDGGWSICNAGAIDIGDDVLVFDTFVNQHAAEEFREAVAHLVGKPISHVVNSHYHSDHVKGNQAFKGAKIVSTIKTRDVMVKSKKHYETDLEAVREEVQRDLESHLASPEDPDTLLFEGYDRGHLDGLSTLEYTLPDVTFEDRMTFYGTKRTAEVMTYGGGHTVSDALLYLPDERVLFMGDLLFVECHPYLADGNPAELFRIFDRVKGLDTKVLVPGHGPVGTLRDIDANMEYVEALKKTVEEVKGSGGGLPQAVEKSIEPAFESWKWRAFRRDNLEFLFQGASGQD